jgi:ferrochelatase
MVLTYSLYYTIIVALLIISLAQAEELKKSLSGKNVPAEVYVGMRYWHPFTEEAIEQVLDDLVLSS